MLYSSELETSSASMRLEDVSPKPGSRKHRRRLGRGVAAGQGASCGKGMRGQKSRSGRGTRPGFEGGQIPLYRRIPKLSNFQAPVSREGKKKKTEINVGKLSSLPPNTEVTLSSLIDVGIVTRDDGPLKVLGDGEISIPLVVKASAFTEKARYKIEEVGGTCEITASAYKSTFDFAAEVTGIDKDIDFNLDWVKSHRKASPGKGIDFNLDWVEGYRTKLAEQIDLSRQVLSAGLFHSK